MVTLSQETTLCNLTYPLMDSLFWLQGSLEGLFWLSCIINSLVLIQIWKYSPLLFSIKCHLNSESYMKSCRNSKFLTFLLQKTTGICCPFCHSPPGIISWAQWDNGTKTEVWSVLGYTNSSLTSASRANTVWISPVPMLRGVSKNVTPNETGCWHLCYQMQQNIEKIPCGFRCISGTTHQVLVFTPYLLHFALQGTLSWPSLGQ